MFSWTDSFAIVDYNPQGVQMDHEWKDGFIGSNDTW